MLARLGQLLSAYLASGIVETIVEMRGGGHADAPLTTFPGYLLLAPFIPVWTVIGLVEAYSASDLMATGVFVLCFIVFWLAFQKWVPFKMS